MARSVHSADGEAIRYKTMITNDLSCCSRRRETDAAQYCCTRATSAFPDAVDGNDLLEIGIEPGPELGSLLGSLLDQVIVDPQLNTKHQLVGRE